MKQQLIALSLLLLVVETMGQGIQFEKGISWEQVIAKAKLADKFIFVECVATWCGPCKEMDEKIYPNEKVGRYFNEHFVSIVAQMDTSKNDDEDTRKWYSDADNIMRKYGINVFPYFLFFSPDGRILDRDIAFKSIDDLINLGKEAINPLYQYYTLVQQYQQGKLDTSNMKYLAHQAKHLGDIQLADSVANEYINCLSDKDIFKLDNIWFMVEFTRSSKDRGFSMFRNYPSKIHRIDLRINDKQSKALVQRIIYNEEMKPYISSKNGKPDWEQMDDNVKKYGLLGKETYALYRSNIIFKMTIEPALRADPTWNNILPLIKKQYTGRGQESLIGSSIVYYLNNLNGNFKDFIASALFYNKKYSNLLTDEVLNGWAWTVFEQSYNWVELATALSWSERSIKMSKKRNGSYLDTYANILYKMKRTAEAIKWERRAVSASPGDNDIQGNYLKMRMRNPTWGSQ